MADKELGEATVRPQADSVSMADDNDDNVNTKECQYKAGVDVENGAQFGNVCTRLERSVKELLSMQIGAHHQTGDFEDPDNLRLYQQLYRYATEGKKGIFNDTIAKKLHDPNASIQLLSRRSPENNTFVHIAVTFGHAQLAAEILQLHKPLLLEKNFEGDTALHIAAKTGDDVNETSALPEPLFGGHQSAAKRLIEADPAVSLYTNKEQKSALYLAAEQGLVEILKIMNERAVDKNTQIQGNSPLLAAILGCHNKEVLKIISNMEANILNSKDEKGRTPLHCAASIDYLDGVRFLLEIRLSDSHQMDHGGNFPIHSASSKGHVKIVKELLRHCPDSRELKNSSGQNILHVAARFGKDNLVKYFLKNGEFRMLINKKDNLGNTPLHLATMYHHHKVVYLLTWDRRTNLKVVNGRGMTALEISESTLETTASSHGTIPAVKAEANGSEQNPRDPSSLKPELDQILLEPGMERKSNKLDRQSPPSRTTAAPAGKIWYKTVATARCLINALVNCLEYPKTWVEATRDMLMVVATMISTATFQAVINPPGGVWGEDKTNGTISYCTDDNRCLAGTAVAGNSYPEGFIMFVRLNTISFLASLSVTLLLVGGFPLQNRLIMWLLSMAMCITLSSMTFTYMQALALVIPDTEFFESYEYDDLFNTSNIAWGSLLLCIALIHTIRLVIWLARKFWRRFKHDIPKSLRNAVDSLTAPARHRTNKF
ncbi:PREDICTED: ankyrin repeat-containing protein At5g02620-like [Prunus mume]|uniref:Ankyrin repeat-containing protein At5g02620-like n=1 Tax=Prunus mume TaxID=102107 RepID=A0ABM0PU78_PRUMU|nr:PREDICTED: ankyrin repeat-containing protein At5g02620-like [Prunus mume]